jgi:hypothetical protein
MGGAMILTPAAATFLHGRDETLRRGLGRIDLAVAAVEEHRLLPEPGPLVHPDQHVSVVEGLSPHAPSRNARGAVFVDHPQREIGLSEIDVSIAIQVDGSVL